MGHSEYDRIRTKNNIWDAADTELARLRSLNLTDGDIINICETQLQTNPTDTRNEIYSTVLKIVRSTNEEVTGSVIPNCS